jgi:hypothetical protein
LENWPRRGEAVVAVGMDLDRCAGNREGPVGRSVVEEEEIEERVLRPVLISLAVVGAFGFAEHQTRDEGNSGIR